jgi:hypothetical protein
MKHEDLFDTEAYQAGLIEAGVEPSIAKAHCAVLMTALIQAQAHWRERIGEPFRLELQNELHPSADLLAEIRKVELEVMNAIKDAELKRLKERIWTLLWLVPTALISAILGSMIR